MIGQINRLGLSSGFENIFTRDELAALLAALATTGELEPLAGLYDGQTLRCRGVEEFTDADGSGVRVGEVVWCEEGRVIAAGPVACRVQEPHRRVFLHWRPEDRPLGRADDSVIHTNAHVELGTEPERHGRKGYEIARLDWKTGRLRIDPNWWPPVARIDRDERSLKAAGRLCELLPNRVPELAYWSRRYGSARWEDLLPLALRCCGNDPGLVATMTAPDFAAGDSDAEWTAGLLKLLGERRGLPPTLGGLRFTRTLSAVRLERAGATQRSYFSTPSALRGMPGSVVVKATVSQSPGEARLRTGGKTFTRPIESGMPALLGALMADEPFVIEVNGGEAIAVGLYHPDGEPIGESGRPA